MQISKTEKGLKVSQPKLITKLLKEFNMEQCKGVSTPMEVNFTVEEAPVIEVPYRRLICSLMYIAVTTRPDLGYSVSYLSRFLDKPTDQAWKAGKRILRYISNTKDMGLYFTKGETGIEGQCDADWAGDKKTRRSVSGFVGFHAGNRVT